LSIPYKSWHTDAVNVTSYGTKAFNQHISPISGWFFLLLEVIRFPVPARKKFGRDKAAADPGDLLQLLVGIVMRSNGTILKYTGIHTTSQVQVNILTTILPHGTENVDINRNDLVNYCLHTRFLIAGRVNNLKAMKEYHTTVITS